MNKQTLIIRNDQIRSRAVHIISGLPLEPVHEIVIREHHKDRSAAANSLYWLWLTIIAAELGETKEDAHQRYKEEILVHIYERDDLEFAEMIQAIRKVAASGMVDEARHLEKQVAKLVSTTTATVHQFTEYLQDIEKDAIGMNIILPHPEDRYYLAMGKKTAGDEHNVKWTEVVDAPLP